jgi:hypothetical protein
MAGNDDCGMRRGRHSIIVKGMRHEAWREKLASRLLSPASGVTDDEKGRSL